MKKSIVRKIIMIFIFMGILPMMLFNYIYIIDSEKNNREEIRESLEKLAGEKSQVLGLTFKQIENEVDNIGSWMDFYKENELSDEDIKKYLESIDVEYDENLNKVINSEKLINYFQDEERYSSNIYIPDHDNIYFYTVKDILNTYFAEKYLSQVSRTLSNIGIGWSYIITKNNVLRIYPYTSMETFEKNHSFEKDIYYWIAAEQDNPEREIRWTVPYVDWCGTGWVITCSRPVYHNDEFYGVVSIDVPLEKINSTVYDFQIQDSGFAFLVDNKGNAIHHPEAMEKNKDKGEPLSINLLSNSKDKNFLGIIEKMMNGEKGFEIYEDISTGRSKAVAYSNIVNPKWSVGIEVDWDDYLEVNYGYSKYLIMIMVPVIILISISGIYFFRRISMPIKILANNVKMLEPGKTREIVKFDREDEIGVLSQAFTKMYESINKYTEDIIRKNININH